MKAPGKISSQFLTKAFCVVVMLAWLAMLAGCQGVSAAGSTPPPVGQLSLGASSLDFGSVAAGSTKALSVTATNSGSKTLTISSAAVSTKYFTLSSPALPLAIASGQSATVNVTFTPNAAGNFSATAGLTSDASDSLVNLTLSGIGVADGTLVLNPTTEAFGTVTVGSTKSQTVTLTNSGGTAVDISQASVSGTGFELTGLTTPLTLNGSQSTTFTVAFAPQAAGGVTGAVTILSNGANPTLAMALSGTGSTTAAPQLSVSPTTLGLGNVVVGTSGTASGSLSASGGSVTITAATTNNSLFSVGGLSLPLTIPSGQSAPFTITFSPTTTSSVSATLTVTSSNAQPSTATETLTGTGTPAPVHTVNLSWNASTSSNISGYNVYRAVYKNSCGGYAKVNAVLNTSTLYSDNSVIDGTSYCYATTAVNSSSQESAYSNVVSNVQIPAP